MSEQLVTLCFIVHDGQVLLMRKKRGIGAGKINAPGGKVDPGEEPLAAAIRETQEEVGVTPVAPELCGDLILRCLIYRTGHYTGTVSETDEAIPRWYGVNELPYNEMWEDDRTWVPLLLSGERFAGTVEVADEKVTGTQVRVLSNEEVAAGMRMHL
jgi:8-oxo-dGTP diphosphatase